MLTLYRYATCWKGISFSKHTRQHQFFFKLSIPCILYISVHRLFLCVVISCFSCFLFCSRELSSVFVQFVLQGVHHVLQGVHHNFEFVVNSSFHILSQVMPRFRTLWVLYKGSLRVCFFLYGNLISWFNMYLTAAIFIFILLVVTFHFDLYAYRC